MPSGRVRLAQTVRCRRRRSRRRCPWHGGTFAGRGTRTWGLHRRKSNLKVCGSTSLSSENTPKVRLPYHLTQIQSHWMRETSRTTFARLGTGDCPASRVLTVRVAGCEKVTGRIGLAGWQEPRLFPGCVAGADSFEIQDALILLALCYLRLRCPRVAAEWHCVASRQD